MEKKWTLRRIHLRQFILKTPIQQARTKGLSGWRIHPRYWFHSIGVSISKRINKPYPLKTKTPIIELNQRKAKSQVASILTLRSTFARSMLSPIMNLQIWLLKIFLLLQWETLLRASRHLLRPTPAKTPKFRCPHMLDQTPSSSAFQWFSSI